VQEQFAAHADAGEQSGDMGQLVAASGVAFVPGDRTRLVRELLEQVADAGGEPEARERVRFVLGEDGRES
jgi:hypothetical protein